jgi:hypothetical protein
MIATQKVCLLLKNVRHVNTNISLRCQLPDAVDDSHNVRAAYIQYVVLHAVSITTLLSTCSRQKKGSIQSLFNKTVCPQLVFKTLVYIWQGPARLFALSYMGPQHRRSRVKTASSNDSLKTGSDMLDGKAGRCWMARCTQLRRVSYKHQNDFANPLKLRLQHLNFMHLLHWFYTHPTIG